MGYKTVKEVADEFRINQSSIKRMIYDGRIKAIKVGRQWRILDEEFERLKKEGSTR